MQQGSVEIKLRTPLKINGVETSVLTMREPTVGDQLAVDLKGGAPGQREKNLIANLCEIPTESMLEMTLHDYLNVQRAFTGFLDLPPDTSGQEL